MRNAIKKLDSAYALLSRLRVEGDNVDLLAGARQELRDCFRLLKQEEEQEARKEGDNG